MKKVLIIVFSTIAVIVIIIGFIISNNYGTDTYYSFDSVTSSDAYCFLLGQGKSGDELIKEQQLLEFGDYKDYYFQFTCNRNIVFTSYGETIICDYSKDNYELQKSEMLNNSFFNDKVINEEGDCVLTQAECDIEKWHFSVMDEKNTNLPKGFRIFGYNDSLQRIAILSFSDQDLDIMEENLKDFIINSFKYDFEKQESIK